MQKKTLILFILMLPFLLAVRQAEGRSPGFLFEVYTGKATFYSDNLHGRKTANGERYNKNAFTAAHRSLPLGTVVRVTNLANGRAELVRINDRGPFKKTLLLDISKEAAKSLNMIKRGVAPVQVEVVSDKRGVPVVPGTAFYLRYAEVKSASEGYKLIRSVAVKKTSPSKGKNNRKGKKKSRIKDRAPKMTVFSSPGLKGKTRYFVGVGPFDYYRDALRVHERVSSDSSRTSIVCLPAIPADWSAAK